MRALKINRALMTFQTFIDVDIPRLETKTRHNEPTMFLGLGIPKFQNCQQNEVCIIFATLRLETHR